MLNAGPQPQKACSLVWAVPISLAATFGIDLSFFSSGYLDVSVPRVPSAQTMYSSVSDWSSTSRVSPFGYQGIYACLRLPLAFRSLPRPSSALGALASTLCSCSLDYKYSRLTFQSASLLRLIASNFRSIDLHYCNWSFKTLCLISVQLSRCVADLSAQDSFQNPENDTD